ncbi:MAG: hypothetical protein KF864_04500 [Phycisphaeraceae bacterium]|nr:hypothetical protein [Phycisphaeraceae bacterium]
MSPAPETPATPATPAGNTTPAAALAELQAQLDQARAALAAVEEARAAEATSRLIDQAAHDAIDPDVVRLLIRESITTTRDAAKNQARALAGQAAAGAAAIAHTAADGGLAAVERAVAELRRRKPFLFTRPAPPPSPAAAAPSAHEDDQRLRDAATRARATGDRRDLLHYLRIRRAK